MISPFLQAQAISREAVLSSDSQLWDAAMYYLKLWRST